MDTCTELRRWTTMIQLMRNFAVGTLLSVAGIVSVASLERALEGLAPAFSDQRVGSTNVSTIAQGVALVVVFFACGFYGSRWVKGRASGGWLLLPLVTLYALAMILAPDIYRPNLEAIGGTLFMHAPFLLPLLATVIGYACFRARNVAARVV